VDGFWVGTDGSTMRFRVGGKNDLVPVSVEYSQWRNHHGIFGNPHTYTNFHPSNSHYTVQGAGVGINGDRTTYPGAAPIEFNYYDVCELVIDGPGAHWKDNWVNNADTALRASDIFRAGVDFIPQRWDSCTADSSSTGLLRCTYSVTTLSYLSNSPQVPSALPVVKPSGNQVTGSNATVFTLELTRRGDLDGDGRTNFDEFQAGTDPYNVDTDGDTLSDDWELDHGLNPLSTDSDGDHLADNNEHTWGLSPTDTDSDDDRALDNVDACWGVAEPSGTPPKFEALLVGIKPNQVFALSSHGQSIFAPISLFIPTESSSQNRQALRLEGAGTLTAGNVTYNNLVLSNANPAWVRDGIVSYKEYETTLAVTQLPSNGLRWKDCKVVAAAGVPEALQCPVSLTTSFTTQNGASGTVLLAEKIPTATHNLIAARKCSASYLTEMPGVGATPLKFTVAYNMEDVDGDGLGNAREVALGTNPLYGDSDGDLINDGDEECACLSTDTDCPTRRAGCRKTDPLKSDSDGDGYSDRADACHHYVSENGGAVSEYPLPEARKVPQDDCDADDDGLADAVELLIYPDGSSAVEPDIDHDGMPDGFEGTEAMQEPGARLTLLYHPLEFASSGEGDDAIRARTAALGQKISQFFAGTGSGDKLRLLVNVKPVASTLSYDRYRNDCRAASAASDSGWLVGANAHTRFSSTFKPNQIDELINDTIEAYGLTPSEAMYTHVGRLCLAESLENSSGVITSADFGQVRGQGNSEFVVRFPPPPEATATAQRAVYEDALVSLVSHQLGHSLNLHHGGRESYDCNPFYPSVMNHAYDFQPTADNCGVPVTFSRGAFAPNPASPSDDLGHLAVPMSEGGWPAAPASTVDVLSCWGFGDELGYELQSCTGPESGSGPVGSFCRNCPADTTCYNLYEPDTGGVHTRLSDDHIASIRTAGALGEPRLSGCDASVLYPSGVYQLEPAGTVLSDHDDIAWMNRSLVLTVPYGRRFGPVPACAADETCPATTLGRQVTEPRATGNFPRWLARDAFGIAP
jgi:hypothetical protein